jgi:hypothetical protein
MPDSRTEEREKSKERGSQNVEGSKHPVRGLMRSDVNTMLDEQQCADRQVRITSDTTMRDCSVDWLPQGLDEAPAIDKLILITL